jgi:hypothetical protein
MQAFANLRPVTAVAGYFDLDFFASRQVQADGKEGGPASPSAKK